MQPDLWIWGGVFADRGDMMTSARSKETGRTQRAKARQAQAEQRFSPSSGILSAAISQSSSSPAHASIYQVPGTWYIAMDARTSTLYLVHGYDKQNMTNDAPCRLSIRWHMGRFTLQGAALVGQYAAIAFFCATRAGTLLPVVPYVCGQGKAVSHRASWSLLL